MKKIIIASTSMILTALPMAGVFAVNGTIVTDTVQVTINSSCTMESGLAANIYSKTMTNEQLLSSDDTEGFGKTAMSISCNDAGGWHLTAIGSGSGSDPTAMAASGSGTDIVTGTATSGATSNWAFKVTGDTATGFTTYKAVPSGATDVASSTGASSEAVVTSGYMVWISATQQADTYTGQVTYTLTHPAA